MGFFKLFCILGGRKVDRSDRNRAEKGEKNTAAFLHIFSLHMSPLSCFSPFFYPVLHPFIRVSFLYLPAFKDKNPQCCLGMGKITRVDWFKDVSLFNKLKSVHELLCLSVCLSIDLSVRQYSFVALVVSACYMCGWFHIRHLSPFSTASC